MANATDNRFTARWNKRGKRELYLEGEHVSIKNLKMRNDIEEQVQKYLSKDVTGYPTPYFHIKELTHVTNKTSLQKIWDSKGFKGFEPRVLDKDTFSWWSLKINEADITAVEERFLKIAFPDRSEEEIAAQQPFLRDFTTSPAFINDTSRYGNFRFTFPLTELMEAYKKQMCEGEDPILRVYETKLFRQEIEYVVLVHSPKFTKNFRQYPLLKNTDTPSPLASYEGNEIIWRAQAICETHNYQLAIHGKTAVKQTMDSFQFYVWDQLSLIFHINKDEVLTFPKRKLKASLSCCALDQKINLSNGENCSSSKEAEKFLESLQDDDEKEDEKEENAFAEVSMEVD
ncbi:uncharacterized protein LOC120487932 [Pimephales promelas]|uniref:uncharacterized protein LOC120487932 n=1 Tax=Pimephales promelas TaxID=90988 RepID=UPI0019558761|nr:uncharacterized protein LOC120487932 [Pimephales promelas]